MKKTLHVLAAALSLAMLFTLAGCATRAPAAECDDLAITVLETPRGVAFILDAQGMRALGERFRMLQHGECRLPAFDRPQA